MKLRFNVWKDWYKRCLDGRVYKIMVLLGLRHSPTFELNLRMARYERNFIQGVEKEEL